MKFDKNTFSKLNIITDVSFLVVISLVWLDELLDIPYLLNLEPETHINVTEAIFESILVLLVWLVNCVIRRRLLNRLIMLEGVIPICSVCKKIRTDDASWQAVEEYVSNHSAVIFSRSICPECQEKFRKGP